MAHAGRRGRLLLLLMRVELADALAERLELFVLVFLAPDRRLLWANRYEERPQLKMAALFRGKTALVDAADVLGMLLTRLCALTH